MLRLCIFSKIPRVTSHRYERLFETLIMTIVSKKQKQKNKNKNKTDKKVDKSKLVVQEQYKSAVSNVNMMTRRVVSFRYK